MTDVPSAARDQPLIAIDVVPVSFTVAEGLRVATARRAYDPYAGREALPGVLLDAAERLADGARRALRTKAGIGTGAVRHLTQVGAFDGPSRDPRETAISIAFTAVVHPVPTPFAATDPGVVSGPAAGAGVGPRCGTRSAGATWASRSTTTRSWVPPSTRCAPGCGGTSR